MANFIYVTGGLKTERKVTEDTIAFCLKKLLPRVRSLEIEVKLKNIKGDAIGYCLMEDNTRTFTLEIQKGQKLKDLITTVTHEMVHVKQYYRKEMNDSLTTSGNAKWKGKRVAPDTTYYDLPWEKEAYRMQDTLANEIWEKGLV